jgi:single-stranded DNA-binding protein
MRNIAEFQIIGRVGKVKEVGSTPRVSICANYPVKDKQGEWQDNPHWNEVVIFQESTQGYVKKHIELGDLVFARGRVRQSRYTKDGEERFTVDLICSDFSRLAKPSGEAASEAPSDNDIPY